MSITTMASENCVSFFVSKEDGNQIGCHLPRKDISLFTEILTNFSKDQGFFPEVEAELDHLFVTASGAGNEIMILIQSKYNDQKAQFFLDKKELEVFIDTLNNVSNTIKKIYKQTNPNKIRCSFSEIA